MKEDAQIKHLLQQVADTESRMFTIENEFNNLKKSNRETLMQTISHLARLADSQATRSYVMRELYWKHRLSTHIIDAGFKIGLGRIRSLAGAYTVNFPCVNGCGRNLEQTYTSRSELEQDEAAQNGNNLRKAYRKKKCTQCTEQEKVSQERTVAASTEQALKRVAELDEMTWLEYIETPEWIAIRNSILHHRGDDCEICKRSNLALNVCLHKDSTVYPVPGYGQIRRQNVHTTYFVLCDDCLSRCEDLLHPEWREKLKVEFLEWIMNNWQSY